MAECDLFDVLTTNESEFDFIYKNSIFKRGPEIKPITMHIEIQVALNFVISYLYNKLPRRRVNIFGEELDRALKAKFDGHWYPEKPFKGSAYRCLRAGTPLDPVIENAARESGVDLSDIRDNLPDELSIWIDPGEVSYRIGEKGSVKIIYADDCLSGGSSGSEEGGSSLLDKERSFNPEAQCFKPIESVTSSLANLAVSMANASSVPAVTLNINVNNNNMNNGNAGGGGGNVSPTFNSSNSSSSSSSPNYANSPSPNSFKHLNNVIHNNNNNSNNLNNNNNNATTNGSSSNSSSSNNQQQQPQQQQPTNGGGVTTTTTTNFVGGKHVTPLTFTTATFAQTKFGSTKLKSSSKRSNRMSPTEFSNYIKQRAMMQQQQQNGVGGGMYVNGASSPQPQRPRSLSPINLLSPADQQHFVFMANHHHQHGQQQQQQQQQFNGLFDNSYLRDLIVVSNSNNANAQQQHAAAHLGVGGPKFTLNGDNTQTNSENNTSATTATSAAASPFLMTGINDNSKSLLDGINFNLNNMPYSSQHLLVAN